MKQDEENYRSYSRYADREPDRYKEPVKPNPIPRIFLTATIIAAAALGGILYVQYYRPFHRTVNSQRPSTADIIYESSTEQVLSEAETQPETETEFIFSPHAVSSTQPENLIAYTELELNGSLISTEDFSPWYAMDFDLGNTYTDVEGVITFRGNNFRDMPAYGTVETPAHSLTTLWQQQTGALSYNGSTWTGSGWTGQPLIQHWPRDIKQHMNMYDSAKSNDDLVEVIYACMDGYVYFLDLVTGQPTRDPLYLGFTFKGSGALDPRGYPILYVGAGYDSSQGRARVFAVSLLDGSILYTFGNEDPFSLRGNLSYFDSSALVDAASDTLIYPGENGILYLIHLGTQYDPEKGTLSLNPDQTLKWHYNGVRTSSASFWVGMEDSCAVYKGYLFVTDNGGNLMCLNLNTMELVWVQDTLDDSNSTPVLSMEDGHLYLYVSTSFRQGWRSFTTASIPIWKINAETGEVVWQTEYTCYTQDGVSGGVQSTIAVGQHALDDRIFVTVSMVGNAYNGVLSCLDKKTGAIKWEHASAYAWSSPVCVYDASGQAEVIYADAQGNLYIVDPENGERLNTMSISNGVVEASPAVYNNYMVIGTRACKIWGIQLG